MPWRGARREHESLPRVSHRVGGRLTDQSQLCVVVNFRNVVKIEESPQALRCRSSNTFARSRDTAIAPGCQLKMPEWRTRMEALLATSPSWSITAVCVPRDGKPGNCASARPPDAAACHFRKRGRNWEEQEEQGGTTGAFPQGPCGLATTGQDSGVNQDLAGLGRQSLLSTSML